MIENKKVVIVIPYGRKRYTEILLSHLMREIDIIDEIRFWLNTSDYSDIAWVKSLKHPKITIDEREGLLNFGTFHAIHYFFNRCTEPDTVYIRIDDDIVWLDNNFIKTLATYRIHNPEPFLVYPNIVNNAIIDFIHQKNGALKASFEIGYACMDKIGWDEPLVAEEKHDNFLSSLDNLDKFRFDIWVLQHYERCSINCIAWLGEEFAKFHGVVEPDEEQWLSVTKPQQILKPCVVYGQPICVHFSFYTQRQHLDKTGILERYKELCNMNQKK